MNGNWEEIMLGDFLEFFLQNYILRTFEQLRKNVGRNKGKLLICK